MDSCHVYDLCIYICIYVCIYIYWTSRIKIKIMPKSVQITAFWVNLYVFEPRPVYLTCWMWFHHRMAGASARFLSFHHSNFTHLRQVSDMLQPTISRHTSPPQRSPETSLPASAVAHLWFSVRPATEPSPGSACGSWLDPDRHLGALQSSGVMGFQPP